MAEVQEHKNVKCDVLGLTVTGVPPECFDELHSILKQKVGKEGVNYLGVFLPDHTLADLQSTGVVVPRQDFNSVTVLCVLVHTMGSGPALLATVKSDLLVLSLNTSCWPLLPRWTTAAAIL